MASFRVVIQASAAAEFKAVPFPFRRQLNQRIQALKDKPRPLASRVVDEDILLLPVGDWGIVYEVDDGALTLTVFAILAMAGR